MEGRGHEDHERDPGRVSELQDQGPPEARRRKRRQVGLRGDDHGGEAASREAALARLVARFGEGDACRGIAVTAATLKQGAPLLADATLEDDGLSLRFDALKRADGASKLGDHHYLPVLHNHGDKVGRQQKLLLAVFGLVLARVQGLRPAVGLVARGPEGQLGKVRLDAKLYRQASRCWTR